MKEESEIDAHFFADGKVIRVLYELRVDCLDRVKAPNAKQPYAIIREHSVRLHAVHFQMQDMLNLEPGAYFQEEWDPRLEVSPPDLIEPEQ